jgi:pyruvate dehydrogenase (quinone)
MNDMAKRTSDFFVERLKTWGVTRIYGYPGDGINGVLGALQRAERAGEGIEFIQVRHEEMAAFMAVAHAKFTGEMGVCLSTGGPGATHLITGLYDAKLDHMPVLAIVGQAEATIRGATYQQEINLDRMFADVADFVQEAAAPAQVRHLVDRGVRIAKARNGVTALILPKDIQDETWQEPARAHGFTRSGPGYTRPRVIPHEADLAAAAAVLNAGRKVAILIGAGARGAADEVVAIAERLGGGVAKALLGKDVLPDDLPFVTGAIGLLGTKPSSDMMEQCDTLLMIGTGFPWAEYLPADGQARAVQIRWRSIFTAMRPKRCARSCPSSPIRRIATGRRASSTACATGTKRSTPARRPAPTPSIRSASSGKCRRACPTMPSSPPIPGPAPTGMRATIA